jgi:hypothetical protein
MAKVETRVKAMPVDVLRNFIKQIARDLSTDERAQFLSRLESVVTPVVDQAPDEALDASLLDEIQDLRKMIDSGELCEGYGWDPEIKDMRDFGDESWSEAVDGFLERARDALLGGHFEVARDAYDAIFSILEMGQEAGYLPAPPDPEELLETDMEEARALYLRATYLAAKRDERPPAILEALLRFEYDVGKEYNVTVMHDAGEDELPAFDEFLSDWKAYLGLPAQKTRQAYSWKQTRQFLLDEAMSLIQHPP